MRVLLSSAALLCALWPRGADSAPTPPANVPTAQWRQCAEPGTYGFRAGDACAAVCAGGKCSGDGVCCYKPVTAGYSAPTPAPCPVGSFPFGIHMGTRCSRACTPEVGTCVGQTCCFNTPTAPTVDGGVK